MINDKKKKKKNTPQKTNKTTKTFVGFKNTNKNQQKQ